jgi:glycyl-tRNA synthetase alpha chain
MGRVRDLARGSCEKYADQMSPEWKTAFPEWSL